MDHRQTLRLTDWILCEDDVSPMVVLVMVAVLGGGGCGGGAAGVVQGKEILQFPQPPLIQHPVVQARIQRPREFVARVLPSPQLAMRRRMGCSVHRVVSDDVTQGGVKIMSSFRHGSRAHLSLWHGSCD